MYGKNRPDGTAKFRTLPSARRFTRSRLVCYRGSTWQGDKIGEDMGNNRAEQERMRDSLELVFPNLTYLIDEENWVRIYGTRLKGSKFYACMCLNTKGDRWGSHVGGGTFEQVRDNMIAHIRKHFGW